MIRTVYSAEPKFPATDQHPDAVRYHFGDVWVDAVGSITEADYVAWDLAGAKASAAVEISELAEARRSAITAAAPGKQGAYLLKYELVLRAGANPPDETAKTLLTAEAQARGLTYDELTTLIAGKRFAWEKAAMVIETIEAASKMQVAAAADRAAVDAAVNTARQLLAEIGG